MVSSSTYSKNQVLRIAGREEFLMQVLGNQEYQNPLEGLELTFCSSEEATRKIMFHEADIALSYHIPHSSELVAKKAFISRPALVWSKSLGIKTFKKEMLTELPLIVYSRKEPVLNELCKTFAISPTKLRFTVVAPSWTAMNFFVNQGQGLALMPGVFANKTGTEICEVRSIMSKNKTCTDYSYSFIYSKSSSRKSEAILRLAPLLEAIHKIF